MASIQLETIEFPSAAHTTSITEATAISTLTAPVETSNIALPDEHGNGQEFTLPQVDRGVKAWKFLAAAFVVEGMCWGMPEAYGLFQEYLTKHSNFGGTGLSVVGTLTSGVIYMSAPLLFPLVAKYPQYRQHSLYLGLGLSISGFLLASFATKLWHLFIGLSIMSAAGSALLYAPTVVLLNEWFFAKRGIALGIMFSATAVAGVTLPFILGWMLDNYGFRTAYRVWAVAVLVLVTPAIPALHGRIPIPTHTTPQPLARAQQRKSNLGRLLQSPMFVLLILANLLQGMANFIPALYLPTFFSDLGQDSRVAPVVLVSVLNGSSIFGRLLMGYMSDKVDLAIPICLSAVTAGFSILFGWGFSRQLPGLIVFAAMFGCFAAGWSVLYSRFCTKTVSQNIIPEHYEGAEVRGSQRGLWYRSEELDIIATIYGALSFTRGIGSILTGPITSALLSGHRMINLSDYGIDKYQNIMIMAGTTMFCAASVGVAGIHSTTIISIGKRAARRARIILSKYAQHNTKLTS